MGPSQHVALWQERWLATGSILLSRRNPHGLLDSMVSTLCDLLYVIDISIVGQRQWTMALRCRMRRCSFSLGCLGLIPGLLYGDLTSVRSLDRELGNYAPQFLPLVLPTAIIDIVHPSCLFVDWLWQCHHLVRSIVLWCQSNSLDDCVLTCSLSVY